MPAPVLELHDVCFGYGRALSIDSVSLHLRAGDCYGFLGHNGAGKTTVLRLVTGLLRPRRGRILVDGIDAHRAPRAARARIGALIERPGFHGHASAAHNLQWLARLQGLSRAAARGAAERVLADAGLQRAADRPVATFSLGMRQRLGVAAALLGEPRLVLLDEPSNGLDPEGIAELRATLRDLVRNTGTAVLLSSHQLHELDGLCTRIGVLREGRMVLEADVGELRSRFSRRNLIESPQPDVVVEALRSRGLQPDRDGDRVLVDLGGESPADVLAGLVARAPVAAFAPVPVTLEGIYLQATRGEAAALAVAGSAPPAAAAAAAAAVFTSIAAPGAGAASGRVLRHELTVLWHRWLLPLSLLVPAIAAVLRVFSYRSHLEELQAKVTAGTLFSADLGSGFLATALALQTALPLLAVLLLGLGSQAVAADLARDTLRNALLRPIGRFDVVVGKLAALLVVLLLGCLATWLAALLAASLLFGFGDLIEHSRGGDQVLAAAEPLWAALPQALLAPLPALAAIALVGCFASALARRPVRALALALLLVLGPELLHGGSDRFGPWLLTSHLPIWLRDDSAVGWFRGMAQGAADALWAWPETTVTAPLLTAGLAVALTALLVRRLRVG